MLLTKYKVQDLIESVEIDMDEVGIKAEAFVEEFDDDSVALVYATIDMLKEQIIDELGRVS
jgi:hypothetical protein